MSREKITQYMDRFYLINRRWPDCYEVWQAATADQSEQLTIAKQRIAELEKDVDILQTNLDAALKRAADFEAANFNNNQFERSSIPLEKFFRDALKGAE